MSVSLYNEAQLAIFVGIWAVLLLGLARMARKKTSSEPDRLYEMQPYVWIARSVLVVVFILLFIAALYEPSVFSFLQGLSVFPLLVLIPIQIPVDALGAFLLHRRGRHYVEQVFAWNFIVLLPYLIIPFFLIYERLIERRERVARLRLAEFAESLPQWMRDTLLHLDRQYGHAKRRGELNLTTKRSRLLAEKGLAKENKDRELKITELGRGVAKVLRSPQAGVAGREDVAPRKLGGRVLGSLPGVLRRIAS